MIIFDLDDTLVDTSKIEQYRRVNWKKCYELIPTETKLNISLEVLEKLKLKYQIAVVTNSPKSYAEQVLKYHKINVDVLIAYHDTKKHKPYPDPMMLAAQKVNFDPKRCLTIGDHMNDILASNSAGMRSIAVTWGKHTLEQFEDIECWKIFSEKKLLEDFLISLI